jgi:hypothetical protein
VLKNRFQSLWLVPRGFFIYFVFKAKQFCLLLNNKTYRKMNSINIKYLRWFFIAIAVAIIGDMVYNVYSSVSKFKADDFDNRSYNKVTYTYREIFSSKGLQQLQPSYTFFKKNKNAVASFVAKNGNYELFVYKISNVDNQKDLNKIISLSKDDFRESVGVAYEPYKNSCTTFSDAVIPPKKSAHIYLSINCEPAPKLIVKNNILFIQTNYINFALKYNHRDETQVFSKKRALNPFKKVPIEIAFVKKDESIYLLFFSPINLDKPIPKNISLTLLK